MLRMGTVASCVQMLAAGKHAHLTKLYIELDVKHIYVGSYHFSSISSGAKTHYSVSNGPN